MDFIEVVLIFRDMEDIEGCGFYVLIMVNNGFRLILVLGYWCMVLLCKEDKMLDSG